MMLRNCILMLVSATSSMLIRRSDMYGDKVIDKSRRSTDEGVKTQVMRSSNEKSALNTKRLCDNEVSCFE